MQSEIENIVNGEGYEYVFQEETGKEGTPHLQGGIYFKNQTAFSSIKKLIPRAHIEACRNWHATKNYCSKGETRTGAVYTNIPNFVDQLQNRSLSSPKIVVKKSLTERVQEDLKNNPPDWSDEPVLNLFNMDLVVEEKEDFNGWQEWRTFCDQK